MPLKEILNTISTTAAENNISKPFLVGGFPRDIYMKNIEKINDIDITCGDKSIYSLSGLVASKLPGSVLTKFDDGHSKLVFGNYKIDFSSNFTIPNIKNILIKSNIKNPTPMQEELYSRDFTINTLLMPLNLKSIIDVTGLAMDDIKNRTIDTCLSPRITLSYDPKRIVRVVYLSAKLNFYPSKRVVKWIRENKKFIHYVNKGYIEEKLEKAKDINPIVTDKVMKLLNV